MTNPLKVADAAKAVRLYTDKQLLDIMFLMIANNPQGFLDAAVEYDQHKHESILLMMVNPRVSEVVYIAKYNDDTYGLHEYALTRSDVSKLQAALDRNGIVTCIKEFRQMFVVGKDQHPHLKISKDIVERMVAVNVLDRNTCPYNINPPSDRNMATIYDYATRRAF